MIYVFFVRLILNAGVDLFVSGCTVGMQKIPIVETYVQLTCGS